MKLTDYQPIIEQLSNPDTAAEGLVALNERLKLDEEDYNKVSESVNTLRDTNAKLALRITSPAPPPADQPPASETPAYDVFEDTLKAFYGIKKEG